MQGGLVVEVVEGGGGGGAGPESRRVVLCVCVVGMAFAGGWVHVAEETKFSSYWYRQHAPAL